MRTGSFLVTAALLLALAGCVPVDSHPSSSPTGSATPVFASHPRIAARARELGIREVVTTGPGEDATVAGMAGFFAKV